MTDGSLKKYYVLMVATLGFVVVGVSLFSYPIMATFVSREYKLSNTESGVLTSIFGITYALMQIPGGVASDHFGGGKTLFISLVVVAVSPLLFVFGNTFGMALLSRAIGGAGSGMILPAGVRQISVWFSEGDLNKAMGVFGSGWGVSQVLAYAFLPLLIVGSAWQPPLYFGVIFTAVAILMALPSLRWMAPRSTVQEARVKIDVGGLFTRQFFALTLPNFAALLVTVGVLSWITPFLAVKLALSQVSAGEMVAMIGLISIFASYAGGFSAHKFGARIVIVISMLLLIICSFLLGISTSWTATVVCALGLGAGSTLYLPSVFALIPYSSKQGRVVAGATFGVFNTLSNIGNFLGPIIVGFILDSTGSFLIGFATLGALAISGIVGAFLIPISVAVKSRG